MDTRWWHHCLTCGRYHCPSEQWWPFWLAAVGVFLGMLAAIPPLLYVYQQWFLWWFR